jgi:hypothetical protein
MPALLDLLAEENEKVTVTYDKRIVRDPELKRLKTVTQTKDLRLVYNKRVRQSDGIKTYPYGYKK